MAARAGAREADVAQRAAESVAELARLAEQLFRDMSRLPGFRAWRPLADPLYRAWLDGALARTVAPPPLFRNRQDFYAAFPQLASGWDVLEKVMAPSAFTDNLPLGSLERQVEDQDGLKWALIVAVPKDGADPREWNEPSAAVVAARVPRWSTDALCYVLAHTVVPRKVLPRLRGPRAFDSLEGVAAALAIA
ncbi:hypothetical protein FCH28_24310 [Streptomyces piniterrae]|uniref:Uncharacterized protein n=1 Tax=Streptomyces piniterrae TaxID=2571125 RepID=A0A4U0NHU7_9ACTN|nr:hypothetical protein [Streptomyces piniterrae]TJZ49444.1 hypothetical protein FCH28_24310 [Streptomyces piniterrae]